MTSQADVKSIDKEGKVSTVRKFDRTDFEHITEFIIQEWSDRKKAREDREKHWAEIDRQIAMQPDIEFKKLKSGEIDPNKKWMSEVEPPLQAQTLEVLTADARRFMFAGGGSWFRGHAEVTDEYLDKIDFKSLILGDKAEVPSIITQDNADKLCEGFLLHQFRQYDLQSRMDRINAEAFKYSMGVGRMRMMTKNVYIHEAMGTRRETQRLPVIVPCSIKKLYLDQPLPSFHSVHEVGPGHIAEDTFKLEKLMLAASKGSSDPNDEDGGWIPSHMKDIEPDKNGYVTVLEYEGDLIVPRKTVRSLVIPGVIVTVIVGEDSKGGVAKRGLIRLRFRKEPYSSYLLFPYHHEDADDPYGSSPLEKGRPLQIMVAEAMNRLLDSAALKNAPPIGYDRMDTFFGNAGGPVIHPYAIWETNEGVTVHDKVGGDPNALVGMLQLGIKLYAELEGVLPARLGSQTVSHTTAFAKEQEVTRGATRTIDYVNASGHGPLTRFLQMNYEMGRNALRRGENLSLFIDAYGGFVQIDREDLPEKCAWEWFGSGGPSEEQVKAQRKLQSLQLAIQMSNLKMQQDQVGGNSVVNLGEAIRSVLRDGGWTDVDVITNAEQAISEALPQAQPNPGAESVALQQLGLAVNQ